MLGVKKEGPMNISYYRNEDQKYIGCIRTKFIHRPLRAHR
jgi:hypothetical protein